MDKRELLKKRAYIAERLPENMLERARLKKENQELRAEKATAEPERTKAARSRLAYIRIRLGELKAEYDSAIEGRRAVVADLKALSKPRKAAS